MKMCKLAAALALTGLLTACQTTVSSPGVKVKTPTGVEIKVEDGSSDDGKFCPPGQAKKGNC